MKENNLPLSKELEALYGLRETINRMDREKPLINFDHVENNMIDACGTYRCLAGWDYFYHTNQYCCHAYSYAVSRDFCDYMADKYSFLGAKIGVDNGGGISKTSWLFGDRVAGTLQDRKNYLETVLIPQYEKQWVESLIKA